MNLELEKKLIKILIESVPMREWLFLHEGIIASYGVSHLINSISNNFAGKYVRYEDVKRYEDKPTKYGNAKVVRILTRLLDKREKEIFYHICDVYGYIITTEKTLNIYGTNCEMITVEQKYPQEIKVSDITHPIVHISPPDSQEKIEKYGLIPKKSKSTFNHTGNVYLLIVSDFSILPKVAKMLEKNRNEKLGKTKYDFTNWVYYKINLEPNRTLYFDNMFLDEGEIDPRFYSVYSKEPISKNNIEKLKS